MDQFDGPNIPTACLFSSIPSSYGGFAGKVPDLPPSARPEKLIEGVRFSRKFIASYNAILLVFLICFTGARWLGRWRRSKWQKTNATTSNLSGSRWAAKAYLRGVDTPPGACSLDSSSTLTGATTPTKLKNDGEVDDERMPLLPQRAAEPRRARVLRSLRAFLMYQPQSLPIINRALPENGTTLAVLALYGLNIFYCLYAIPFQRSMLLVFADRFGCVFVTNLPLLYLMAAKNQPLGRLTGRSYESLNIFHRRLGELLCLLALLHMTGAFILWYTFLRPVLQITLVRFIANKVILLGLGAFISYETLYFTSLGSFRQRWYELFLSLHITLQCTGAIFLWFHYETSRPYVGVAVAIFVIDRIIYRTRFKFATLEATLDITKDGETVLLSADWEILAVNSKRKTISQSVLHGWKPTDHVFLKVPALSRSDILQAHPFTIASAAPNVLDQHSHAWLSLLIRSKDGFSRKLLEYAQAHNRVQVSFDGPYGSRKSLDTLQDSDLAVVVAGGSGISVAFPLIWALLQPSTRSSGPENATLEQLAPAKQKVCLLWVIQSESHLSWLPEERLDELKERGLELCIPPPTAQNGRPDVVEILNHWVYRHSDYKRTAVLASGPDGMNRDVRNACSRLMREGRDVRVLVEKFGW